MDERDQVTPLHPQVETDFPQFPIVHQLPKDKTSVLHLQCVNFGGKMSSQAEKNTSPGSVLILASATMLLLGQWQGRSRAMRR